MPATFFHVEAYAPVSLGEKATLYGVIGEACRDPGFHPHVNNPLEPIVLWGTHPRALLPLIENLRTAGTDRGVRRIPATFPLLIGAVASLPVSPAAFDRDPELRQRVEAWIELTLQFFLAEFAGALKSVVLHRDEPYLHVHAFSLPTPDPVTCAVTVESIWRPMAAQGLARRNGESWWDQRRAFKDSAKEAQDRYYVTVGQPAHLERLGPDPDRRRRPRHDHLAQREAEENQRAAAAEVAVANARAEEWLRRMRDLRVEAAAEIVNLRAENARLAEALRNARPDPNDAAPQP